MKHPIMVVVILTCFPVILIAEETNPTEQINNTEDAIEIIETNQTEMLNQQGIITQKSKNMNNESTQERSEFSALEVRLPPIPLQDDEWLPAEWTEIP